MTAPKRYRLPEPMRTLHETDEAYAARVRAYEAAVAPHGRRTGTTAPVRITRRRVIGTVAERMERIAAVYPANRRTLPARVDGPRLAAQLRDLAEVLRTLEDHGPAVAWSVLTDLEDA
ncbi:hypothetical protein ACFCZ3_20045 [Cellulosimicrobium cellulans]|uniref:hypothetical protein n=1 Tax=Cellulosimicrobium cellulans TaxID=1710 RepID=UPI0035DCCDEA